ncbi:MAG: YodL domain-containing protein, partial [Eubacteriales bacterium]
AWLVEKNLNVVWKEGVYLRLVDSSGSYSDEKSGGIMAVRIWRLKPDFPMEARFMFLEDLQVRFGEPIMDNYQAIFTEEMGTENLDTIYSHLSQRTPDFLPGFGYPLSVSDVIELFDKEQREFYFIDRYRFEKIPFIPN